jgi:hypothetical protein
MPGHISDFTEHFLYCTYIGTNQHVEFLALKKNFSSQNGGSKFGGKFEKNEVSVWVCANNSRSISRSSILKERADSPENSASK